MLLINIKETFERDPNGAEPSSKLAESDKKYHDTEGWKSLETSMRIL